MKTIKINNETYVSESDYNALAKKKAGKTIVNGQEIPFVIGGKYFFRTVTYFATGEVEAIKGHFLVLKDAAVVFDTGRFTDAMKTGVLNEVEPVEASFFINLNTIVDASVWSHALPREQK
jgi:hypothetical protein